MKRTITALAALIIGTLATVGCTPDQMRAWFDTQGVDHSAMTEAEIQWYADAATEWWANPPTTTTTAPIPVRPVLPPFLVCVRWRESRDNYQALNPSSGASGAFQYLRSTWVGLGYANKYGAGEARWAQPWQQDEAAIDTYRRYGRTPWVTAPGC